MSHASLSGTWSGSYRYPGEAFPETVFSAVIEERDALFTGTTQEPNISRPWIGDAVITADIDGTREGCDVRFSKFMNGSGGMRHVVLYEGVANEKLSRIEGRWTIPGEWSGSFFMERDDDGASEAVRRSTEEEVGR